jgi:phosphoribosylamine---glycine ligase
MNVLILGSGGREHAMAWKIAQSPRLTKLFVAPGNPGTAMFAQNVPLKILDFDSIGQFVIENNVDLVLVGPEEPLVKGIHDFFLSNPKLKNVSVIGPQAKGAMLEGSKDFAKGFMLRNQIPTAVYKSITKESINEGFKFLKTLKPPYVLKADGLAAGKGVLILQSLDEAEKELGEMLNGMFGESSRTVVIEEFLDGIELSVFVLTDGSSYKILPEAKDYKRVGQGDSGPNTGGMGAVSPVPFAGSDFMDKVEKQIVIPTINGLQKENIPYKGFIFLGLIKVGENPFVIEYNVRMGDPETEAVMLRIKSDFLDLLGAVGEGSLILKNIEVEPDVATTVMLVSGGYPGKYEKGKKILHMEKDSDSIIFHSGTNQIGNDIVTDGGRVLAISSIGMDKEEALAKCYKTAKQIHFEGKYYRPDIGFDL